MPGGWVDDGEFLEFFSGGVVDVMLCFGVLIAFVVAYSCRRVHGVVMAFMSLARLGSLQERTGHICMRTAFWVGIYVDFRPWVDGIGRSLGCFMGHCY